MVLRIFKMIATSGFVTALERTKFVFGWGSPILPSCFKGPTSKREEEGKGKGEGKGRGGVGGTVPFSANPGSAPG